MKKLFLVPFMVAAFSVGSIGSAVANDYGISKSDCSKCEKKPGSRPGVIGK